MAIAQWRRLQRPEHLAAEQEARPAGGPGSQGIIPPIASDQSQAAERDQSAHRLPAVTQPSRSALPVNPQLKPMRLGAV